jgi:hypothetical protein
MLNFYQMNLLIEEDRSIYTDPRVPPPAKYNLADYMSQITSTPDAICGVHEKGYSHELRPLSQQDQMRYAAPDYGDQPEELKDWGWTPDYEGNTTKLGAPLDDEGFKRYTGITW